MKTTRTDRLKTFILLLAAAGLTLGLAFYVAGRTDIADLVWIAGVVPALAALVVEILRSLRSGEVGLDIVAALSMSAALVFGETLAAAVVAVMYSGGTFLEAFAEGRARREMHDLLSRVPRTATRHRNGGLEDVPLDEIAPGDRLLIRQGDVVPVDGTVASEAAFVDTSALTGESLPVRLAHGAEAISGSTNAGEAFDLTATREARDSTYAGIVRLVEEAQASKAPMSRLADRWSLGFLAVTVSIAFAAWWFTGDPIRAVAVLVVATPCPLILAVPVALVAGLSRAAHFGVLIKGAGPLETMAHIRTLILDKTGTLTDGRPQIVSIDSHDGMAEDDILRLAAALDQASRHPVAQAIVAAAKERGLALPVPSEVAEGPVRETRLEAGWQPPYPLRMTKPNPFRCFKTSPEIIRLAVMLYIRFPLSLRNVEDLLHERGIDVSHETIRFWWHRFGPMFAAEIRRKRIDKLRAFSNWRWHVDEVFVKINGERHYLWRAVDHEGEVLETIVTKRRNKKAALKFLRKLMRRYGRPQEIVTDRLPSYRAALRALGASDLQSSGRWLNNRVENSHLPLRRRERAMLRFRRMRSLQTFAAVHSSVHNHFNQERSLSSRNIFKRKRTAALEEWRQLCSV